MPAPLAVRGRTLCFVMFDVAEALDLAAVPEALRPAPAPIVLRKPAPPYVAYDVAPMLVELGELSVPIGAKTAVASASARLFDFGVISVCLAFALPDELDALPAYAQALANSGLVAEARRICDALLAALGPALRRPGPSDLVEDYFVFHVADAGGATAQDLLREHAATFAGTLAMDAGELAPSQIELLLEDPLSYAPQDLFLAQWGGAVLVDDDCEDTLAVLEFLNVQLLELRFLDRRLDEALARFSHGLEQRERPWQVLRDPDREKIRRLSDLTADSLRLAEPVENALRLLPDIYLARVHRRCAARLGLAAWQSSVDRKIDAVRNLTATLTERAAARRAELLELTIILLIALEIVLAFVVG
jgi:hypothetical protein